MLLFSGRPKCCVADPDPNRSETFWQGCGSASLYCGAGFSLKSGSRSSVSLWIRILLFIKVMQICDRWSDDPLGLHFAPTRLHCEGLKRSMAPFGAYKAPDFNLYADPDPDFTLMRIRIQLLKIMWIYADPDPQPCF
jgi:hypothetical protein